MYSFITYVPGIISHLNLCVPVLNTHARSLFCFIFMRYETCGSFSVQLLSKAWKAADKAALLSFPSTFTPASKLLFAIATPWKRELYCLVIATENKDSGL